MITMLIITNPVEHTKLHLPSILIKNQVQDNGQKRLVILNRHPSKLMQSNARWFIKVLGQKIKDTLAFNQSSDVAQNIFTFMLFNALKPRTTFTQIASIVWHKHTKQQVQLRTMHQSKEKL
jgi:hypothetical protein